MNRLLTAFLITHVELRFEKNILIFFELRSNLTSNHNLFFFLPKYIAHIFQT